MVEHEPRKNTPKGTVNLTKLDDNLSRAKARIIELAWCNQWDYFVTLTLDPVKYDRFNLKNFRTDLSQWLRNYGRKTNTKIDYLLIPEKHKDGAWHMHGFIKGLPRECLREFTLEEKLPHYLRTKIKANQAQYDWDDYRLKFGYINCETIKNHKAVSKYVMKYITKDMSRSVSEANMHLYYCSKGLNRAELIAKGTMSPHIVPNYDFQNEHVAIMWLEANVPLDDYIIAHEPTSIKINMPKEKQNYVRKEYKNRSITS